MAVFVDDLESHVMSNAAASDEIIVISGYFSVDIIEKLAKLGKKITFYDALNDLRSLSNLDVYVTGCRLFFPDRMMLQR